MNISGSLSDFLLQVIFAGILLLVAMVAAKGVRSRSGHGYIFEPANPLFVVAFILFSIGMISSALWNKFKPPEHSERFDFNRFEMTWNNADQTTIPTSNARVTLQPTQKRWNGKDHTLPADYWDYSAYVEFKKPFLATPDILCSVVEQPETKLYHRWQIIEETPSPVGFNLVIRVYMFGNGSDTEWQNNSYDTVWSVEYVARGIEP